MSYSVYITNHPVDGPTHGQRCSETSTIYFKSIGYNAGDPPPVFELTFDAAILTNYHKGKSDPTKGSAGVNARTWVSKKVGKFQRVKLVLKGSSHPANGYKYDVKIGGQTWDPRVVPR